MQQQQQQKIPQCDNIFVCFTFAKVTEIVTFVYFQVEK